jgi:hypothetical protein
MNKDNITKNFIIGTFVLLYILTSCISTIHVIDFFKLSNPDWLATTLAIAFEIGAAASLASIIALKKMNKGIVWGLFFILTLMQAMGNTYYAYTHLANYQSWIELFGLVDNDIIEQKRILSLVSGAILPLVALGFIKSLVDYIKPESETPQVPIPDEIVLVNKNEPAVDIVEPIIEPVVEGVIEPVVEEVIESVVEEVIEPVVEVSEAVAENKVDDPKMNILNKVKVFVNGDLK